MYSTVWLLAELGTILHLRSGLALNLAVAFAFFHFFVEPRWLLFYCVVSESLCIRFHKFGVSRSSSQTLKASQKKNFFLVLHVSRQAAHNCSQGLVQPKLAKFVNGISS